MSQANTIRTFILKHVESSPQDIVAIAMKHFSVTRTTIHRHINILVKEGKLIKSGTNTHLRYYLSNSLNQIHKYEITKQLNEFDAYQQQFEPALKILPNSIEDICHYGFTEIFNNAIDHARANIIIASMVLSENRLTITIEDNGIGIFKNINDYLKLKDLKESVLHLSKGKLTTDPINHTGEGIFFSSRSFDSFQISANGLIYYRDNKEQDWGLAHAKEKHVGSKVSMQISTESKNNLLKTFKAYQDDNNLEFDKTEVLVELSRLNQETLISRSQAKRVLMGLEKFNVITLDFKRVRLVGQGFADEVFRVYQQANPDKKITYVNASEEVEFMLKRSISK
jgi:anti-sigma regulatory factor (Ser/Thr protein kinase)